MELAYLFRALMRRKWIILGCIAVSVVIAFFLTRNLKETYKSEAQLSTGFTEADIPGINQGVNYLQSEMKFNNAKENITSPKVLSLVSYHLLLHDLQSETPFTVPEKPIRLSAAEKQATILILSSHLDSMQMLSPGIPEEKSILSQLSNHGYDIDVIDNNLKVDRYLKSDYIDIEYSSENPNLSAFVVNTLCDEFKRFYGQNEKQRTSSSFTRLDSLVNQKKAILDQKQAARERYMTSHGILDANLEGTNRLNQITNFDNLLITEQGIQKNQSFRVQQLDALIQTAKSKGLTTISTPNDIANNSNSQFLALRKQYNEVSDQYIQSGGTDQDLKKKLDGISQSMRNISIVETSPKVSTDNQAQLSLDQLTQRKIDAQAQLEEANQKVQTLQAKLAELRSGLNGIAASSAVVTQLDKDIQIASAEYTSAKDQLNIATSFNETKPKNFKQTLLGEPAMSPVRSKRPLIIGAAGFGSLMLSCLIIVLLEIMDQSIKTPSHFLDLTRLPLIGVVNYVRLGGKSVLDRVNYLDEKEMQRDNTFLELLRKLRYEMESSGKNVFLFTSMRPQQGKTTLIQALAYILSLGKKKVLIIDTNFCDNELTKSINAESKITIESFDLDGRGFNPSDLNEVIAHTNIPDVDLIGCKGGDYTPSEILPKNHLLNHIDKLKEMYDFILLEGAALNEFSDTKELLPFADGMIAIFSSQAEFTAADKESIKFLQENKNKFVGAILNKVENKNLEF